MATLAALEGPNARLSPEEFDRMCVDGEFGDVHVEMLSEGEVRVKVGQGPFHIAALVLLEAAMRPHIDAVDLRPIYGSTVAMGPLRPEPDFALVRFDPRRPRLLTSEDVHFIAEVAITSLVTDRLAKTAIYAEAGVAEYWIIIRSRDRSRSTGIWRKDGTPYYGWLRRARPSMCSPSLDCRSQWTICSRSQSSGMAVRPRPLGRG